jgi:phenylalanyl-tRNA synthetase beta chain
MRVSLNWLNDYIDLKDIPLPTLIATLTNLGLEVESADPVQPWQGDVVVGRIQRAQPHPNAEALQICEVDCGDQEPLTIVCGAPNARQDLTVAVAKVGAVLPGDFKIKASKIRGEKSFGMICSGQELKISDDHEGILELDAGLTPGTCLAEHLQLRDHIIEIGLTPNRADCLGYVGIARDLAAKLKRPLKIPELPANLGDQELHTQEVIRIEVGNHEDCARFTALLMKDIQVLESPAWLQRRLENTGMRAINLVVDATNYIMLETGQPIHAYDLRDIGGGVIKVRRASPGEALTTLDGTKRTLSEEDIVIADDNRAIGLAGVMGGENSEVKDDTSDILIEVAHFNSSRVRQTAKRYGLNSEASHRFERGIDIHNLAYINQRVARFIQSILEEVKGTQAGQAKIAGELVDEGFSQAPLSRIALRMDRVRQISGLSTITQQDCIELLERLGFGFLDKTVERAVFEVPPWRLDIIREIDLIEEITRLYGYEHIPYTLPIMEIGAAAENPLIEFTDQAKLSMAEMGFTEIISFPFCSTADLDQLNLSAEHPYRRTVELANPLVEESRFLRPTLSLSMLKALQENRRHGLTGSKLFECARNFYEPEGPFPAAFEDFKPTLNQHGSHLQGQARSEDRPIERNCLAGILDQPFQPKTWLQAEQSAHFFQAKAAIVKLMGDFGIDRLKLERPLPEWYPWLHPSAAAIIRIDEAQAGYLGEIHPRIAQAYGFDFANPPVIFEVDLDCLLTDCQKDSQYESAAIRFPPVTRDIALVVDQQTQHSDVDLALDSFKRRKHLKKMQLFDVYRGDNVAAGKKSMAYALQFQSPKKTLTDKEVEKELQALLDHLKTSISAELR